MSYKESVQMFAILLALLAIVLLAWLTNWHTTLYNAYLDWLAERKERKGKKKDEESK